MIPADPCIDTKLVPKGSVPIIIGKNQKGVLPLPCIATPTGQVITRWVLTQEEKAAIYSGEDVFITIDTAGKPLQPILPSVGPLDLR